MPFTLLTEDEREFMAAQAKLPDRVVGLVYPALIDRRLELMIKSQWRDDGKDLLQDLFRDGAPMGAFDTRVKVAFAIRLYDEPLLRDLRLIVKIRNDFAHRVEAKDFDAAPVCNRINELKLIDAYPKQELPVTPKTREEWVAITMRTSRLIDLKPRRHRFLRAVEIVLTWLSIQSGDLTFAASPPRPTHHTSS